MKNKVCATSALVHIKCALNDLRSLKNIIGIKHGFLCINNCWAPREALKPEPERRGFQPSRGTQQLLMHQKEHV